jgi:hypothetical protein
MDILLLILVGFCVYFLPGINACMRHHRNESAITALNLLLGWTLLGWVIALVWSFTDNVNPPKGARS